MSSLEQNPPVKLATDGGQSVDVLYGHLRTAILRGDIAPGDELSQVRLSKSLGVSRTPLREALRMLLREGLVEGEPNQPLRVAGFSIVDMEQLYVERVALEAVAIRITVPQLASPELAAMEGLFAEMVHFAAQEEYENWEVPHRSLHLAFVTHAGKRLIDLITQFSEHAERYRRLYTTHVPDGWVAGIHEHRAIIDACKARDADTAARSLAEHLGHVALGIIELVEPNYQPDALRIAITAAGARSARRR